MVRPSETTVTVKALIGALLGAWMVTERWVTESEKAGSLLGAAASGLGRRFHDPEAPFPLMGRTVCVDESFVGIEERLLRIIVETAGSGSLLLAHQADPSQADILLVGNGYNAAASGSGGFDKRPRAMTKAEFLKFLIPC